MPPTKQRRKSDRVMACKQCPACEDQVPVACKSCPCGHLFPTRSKAKQKKLEDANRGDNSGQDSNTAASEADKSGVNDGTDVPAKRRTVRTKRFPPDFFTPMDDQTPKRKTKESSGKSPDKVKRRRNRSKSSTSSVKEDVSKQAPASTPDDDLFANMPAEKALQYSVILAELNRKMTTQHFRPL